MKALFKSAAVIVVAYLVYRLLTEFLRPVSVRLDDELGSPLPYNEPSTTSGPAYSRGPQDLQTQQVNVNDVDAATLTTLPGIGPALAARIVAYREENGPFKSSADLTKVSGVGTALKEKLEPFVVV